MSFGPKSSFTPPKVWGTTKSLSGSISPGKPSPGGGNASSNNDSRGWKNDRAPDARFGFPPSLVLALKVLGSQLPRKAGLPFWPWTIPELQLQILLHGLVDFLG